MPFVLLIPSFKMLSSLFCCSTDTRDDGDEAKYQNPRREPGTREIKANDEMLLDNPGKKKKEKREKLDYDDNSINETDTIANTNEEPTPTTMRSNRHVGGGNAGENNHSDSNEGSSKDHDRGTQVNEHDTSYNSSSSNSDPVAANGLAVPNNEGLVTDANDNVVIAQAGPHEDTVDLDLQDFDEESLMDLAKFQEGQYQNPETGWLLGKKEAKYGKKKCLILDLDETLVHSSFKYLRTADFVIPVEIDNQVHHVYVIKRPGVDEFLKKVGEWYEVVVFTASVLKYGDPLLDKLDIHKSVHHRLFRDSCYNYEGNFIKNLSQIGRPLNESIIIDNSPASYIFHPQHSVPISSWFSDTHDNELLDLLPFLHDLSKSNVDDVGLVLDVML